MHIVKIYKIHLNASILGCFKGCGYNLRATFNGTDTVVEHFHLPNPLSQVMQFSVNGKTAPPDGKILKH